MDDASNCECDSHCGDLSASEIIQQLVQLIKDPVSSLLIHRHICLIRNYFTKSHGKIMIGDLPYISTVLDYLCCLNEEIPEYKSPLYHLLYVLSKPPFLSKMSDSLLCETILKDFFNILGGLLFKLLAEPFLQSCILSIIHNLLIRNSPQHKSVVNSTLCVEGLQKSEMCKHLSSLISLKAEFNVDETLIIIDNIVLLSQDCCLQFLKCNLHELFLLHLDPEQQLKFNIRSNQQRQDSIIRILWVLLQCYQSKHNREQLKINSPSVESLRNLTRLLRYETTRTYKSLETKFHRNNIAAILLQLVFLFPKMELESHNLLDDINSFAIMPIEVDSEDWASSVVLSNSEEDRIFKKLMIMTACLTVINNPKKITVIKEKTTKLMGTLLDFLNPWTMPDTALQWTKIYDRDFLNFSLKVMPMLLPVHADEFIEENGLLRMMDLLELFKYDTIYVDLLQWLVKSLNRICDYFHRKEKNNDCARSFKLSENSRPLLIIGLCKRILNTNAMSLAYQQILTHLLCVLQILIENDDKNYLNQQCLLELVHTCLDRINNPMEGDSLMSNRLQVATSDFVWSCVIFSSDNCKTFIQKNGIYQILDALQGCEFPIKSVLLSALVDICEDYSSIPYLLTWHSVKNKKKIGLISMLCEFWRFQEKWDCCSRDENSCISDNERVCITSDQFKLFLKMGENTSENTSSPTTLNMLGNVRPKIYAIVHFIQERYKDVTNVVQEQYGIDFKSNLSTTDEVTFILINAFYRLKFGEIWRELDSDYLNRKPPSRVTPLFRDIIHKLSLRYLHWANYFQAEQKNVIQKVEDKILQEEKEFFTIHNDSQIAPAMKALREICFNARVENRDFLLNAKQKMEAQIVNCRLKTGISSGISIYPRDLNITTMTAVRKPILMHSQGREREGSVSYVHQGGKLTPYDFEDLVSPQSSDESVSHLTDSLYEDAVKDESLCHF